MSQIARCLGFGLLLLGLMASPALAKHHHSKNTAKEPSKRAAKKEAKAEPAQVAKPVPPYWGKKWEYKSVRLNVPKNEKWKMRWDELGSRGWELAGQLESYYIFKRPLRRD